MLGEFFCQKCTPSFVTMDFVVQTMLAKRKYSSVQSGRVAVVVVVVFAVSPPFYSLDVNAERCTTTLISPLLVDLCIYGWERTILCVMTRFCILNIIFMLIVLAQSSKTVSGAFTYISRSMHSQKRHA